MGERTELQTILETIIGSDAVYFQPPASIQMNYPCIVYIRSDFNTKFANNNVYLVGKEYTITVIDSDPDSPIPDKVAVLPQCIFNRHYAVDNLNHDVFTLFF